MKNLSSAAVFLGLLATAVDASAMPAASDGRWHRVAGDNAFVRSDASATVAYPIGRLAPGEFVEVLEERFGWARVRPEGEAFAGMHAFIAADATAAAGEGIVRVTVPAPLRAANLAAREDPARSWKEVARLQPGVELRLVESLASDGRTMQKVLLPPQASVWVNTAFLVAASPEEIAARAAARMPAAAATGGLEILPPRSAPSAAIVSGAGIADPLDGDGDLPDAPVGADLLGGETEVVEVVAETPPPPAAIEDLDSVWKRIAEGPSPSASDLGELRQRYLVLAESSSTSAAVRSRAVLRAEQLRLQEEIQSRLANLRRMQEQTLLEVEAIRETRRVLEARADYAAVGRLNASAVYDGRRLPRLFRLQETGEGPTLAYLMPSAGIDLATMTGRLVGVAGTVRYDEGLRVNLITPVRIDLLAETEP